MVLDIAARNNKLDDLYPSSGTIGYALLLSGTLVNTVCTINTSTDVLTTSNPNPGYKDASRIRLTTDGTFPTVASGDPIDNATDYYIYKVDADEFKLCRTQADALAGSNFIDFTSTGSGSLTVNEQTLNVNDPLTVLVNKELSHPEYTRFTIADIGSATGGQKTVVYAIAVISETMTFRHKLVILGGSSTIGDTTGTKDHLFTESVDKVTNTGQTATISLQFRLSNP